MSAITENADIWKGDRSGCRPVPSSERGPDKESSGAEDFLTWKLIVLATGKGPEIEVRSDSFRDPTAGRGVVVWRYHRLSGVFHGGKRGEH